MRIETAIQIEDNSGELVALFIEAEYEPAHSPTIEWGIQTEAATGEIIEVLRIDGEHPDTVFDRRFDEAYNYDGFYRKLHNAIREQFDRDFDLYTF
jgi:hypothetical protein